MTESVLEVSASAFKARCLAIFKDIEAGRYAKVVVTRRGKPVAELSAPAERSLPDPFGALAGRAIIPDSLDLTAPILEDIPEAEEGSPAHR